MVLGQNSWPLAPSANNFNIPREIQPAVDKFTRFYNEAHSGRKLTWLWHVSKNELKTTYLKEKYIFMTSAYQMAILTQFNENDTLSFKDIQTGTQFTEAFLKPQLQLLVKAKVLLQDEDTYDLNLNFKSKKVRSRLLHLAETNRKPHPWGLVRVSPR